MALHSAPTLPLRLTFSCLLLLFIVPLCLGDEFPDVPDKHLPLLKSIPLHDQIVLEVRSDGRTVTPEIGIFDLTTRAESKWDLSPEVFSGINPSGTVQHASWAPGIQSLLYARSDRVLLLTKTGTATELRLRMPGQLQPLEGMSSYVVSPDGQAVTYFLYTRDRANKLYMDLMVQSTEGSEPVSISKGIVPFSLDWNYDNSKIAYATGEGDIIIVDRYGKKIQSIHPGPHPGSRPKFGDISDLILHVRWDPKGDRLAFLMGDPRRIFVINMDDKDLRAVEYRAAGITDHGFDIYSFAWSPDGRQFAFRSNYQAREKCNYNLGYKFDTGKFPCLTGENLFTSNVDGSNLKKVTPKFDYVSGELFWVQ